MNERIKELMWDAGLNSNYVEGFDSIYSEQLENFAELIVRECAAVCMKEIDIGWAMALKSPWMAKQILEHFGVE